MAKYGVKRTLEIGGGRGIFSIEYARVDNADWTIFCAAQKAGVKRYIEFSNEYLQNKKYS